MSARPDDADVGVLADCYALLLDSIRRRRAEQASNTDPRLAQAVERALSSMRSGMPPGLANTIAAREHEQTGTGATRRSGAGAPAQLAAADDAQPAGGDAGKVML